MGGGELWVQVLLSRLPVLYIVVHQKQIAPIYFLIALMVAQIIIK